MGRQIKKSCIAFMVSRSTFLGGEGKSELIRFPESEFPFSFILHLTGKAGVMAKQL